MCKERNIATLQADSLVKVKAGITTYEEILRADGGTGQQSYEDSIRITEYAGGVVDRCRSGRGLHTGRARTSAGRWCPAGSSPAPLTDERGDEIAGRRKYIVDIKPQGGARGRDGGCKGRAGGGGRPISVGKGEKDVG